MNMDEYQKQCKSTASYPNVGNNLIYTCLGLAGESGEFIDKVKKLVRQNKQPNEAEQNALALELGDILWYIAMAAEELDCDLEEVARQNLAKLQSRKNRNLIQGEGDNR